jgi:hypothetical protein
VLERRRAVALAHHFREAEGLSIAAIAERLGRPPATVKAYFYDPAWADTYVMGTTSAPKRRLAFDAGGGQLTVIGTLSVLFELFVSPGTFPIAAVSE